MINKCCCCVPLRLGVAIIALLSLVGVLAYLVLEKDSLLLQEDTSHINLDAVYYTGLVVTSLNIIASLFGILGAGMRKKSLIRVFKHVYWVMAVVIIAASIAIWIFIAVRRTDLYESCAFYYERDYALEGFDVTAEATGVCNKIMLGLLVGGGVAVLVGAAISIYFACVISAYVERLKRSSLHRPLRDLEQFTEMSYQKAVY
ncbi:hypothetical protein BX666DRAFT_2023695 [Dichotomocladium elegans]|nr:hypothetical protein BX666DRAFT_2023695 [Dichotomocladium elegans]